MQTIFSGMAFFESFQDPAGWLAFLVCSAVLGWQAYRLRRFQPQATRTFWILFAICLVIIPIAGSIAGFRLPNGGALPPPGIPFDAPRPILLLFGFVPAFLAAGILGPGPGLAVGALTGAWVGLFQTHNLLTIVEYGALALLFSWGVNQRYRTLFYRLLRNPAVSAAVLGLLYPALNTVSNVLLYSQPLVLRIDFALSRVWVESLAVGGSLLTAGLTAWVVSLVIPRFWSINQRLEPSPSELKIETRFIYQFGPLALFFVLALLWGDWIAAGDAAEKLLTDRMETIGRAAADSISPFLETGQNLLLEMAEEPGLQSGSIDVVQNTLSQQVRQFPYFYQLSLYGTNHNLLSGYPVSDLNKLQTPADARSGIDRVITSKVPYQLFSAEPMPEGQAARLIMMTPVYSDTGELFGVLVGECGLDANPFSETILTSLDAVSNIMGEGIILDAAGRILYHPSESQLFKSYSGQIKVGEDTFSELSPIGTRNLIYSRPISSLPWTVVVSVPAAQATQLSLNIAAPLFLILLVTLIALAVLVRLAIRSITKPIQLLAEEAARISSGVLTSEIDVESVDEVGILGSAFEQMRMNLSADLREIQSILTVSQGVAASLNMSEAALPILKAASAYGADSARIVLSSHALPEYHKGMPTRFGFGPLNEKYRAFDERIWERTQQKPRLILTNPANAGLGKGIDEPVPGAVIAVALQYEMVNYGALWIAYEHPHTFTDEEARFITAVGGQAALAAANTALYQRYQLGHQRLQTVIEATPDAVLVTNREGELILSNPAAWKLLNSGKPFADHTPAERLIDRDDLLGMLQSREPGPHYLELRFADDSVYQAAAVETRTPEGYMGKVCLLHDITQFKELNEMKTEFVSTVSHRLLGPLEHIQGFTSMISAVGETNPKQEKYIADISSKVEDMNRMVNNLLDLRRIESGLNLDIEEFSFSDLVEQAAVKQKLLANQRKITISLPENTQDYRIKADKTLIESALINLLDNAIRYSKANGNIDIDYDFKGGQLEFSITDYGIGISEIDQGRVFDQFYQIVRSPEGEQAGSGLGLTITKNAIERHGGAVNLKSVLGKGSTFSFSIPRE